MLFFFNDTATTEIYTLSLHDALPILHTNALDEALALPTDFSARIARNTQLFLQQESGTTRIIDPWGGSYYVERLTYELAQKAWSHIQEVESLGGMADRKSTRLNSSHANISYAVFCLKKK